MPPEILRADAKQLARFVDGAFRYADDGTVVSMRAFGLRQKPYWDGLPRPVKINGEGLRPVIEAAVRGATAAANASEPITFCPPIATFRPPAGEEWRAREQDLANGLVLTVECDAQPCAARMRLEAILGPATFVVASGGTWVGPQGEAEPKLHLHWRLSEPTRTPEEHARLVLARAMACELVGADATSKNPVHPLRWPGSYNKKGKPKLAYILADNIAAEIHLEEAIERLGASVQQLPRAERERIERASDGEPRDDAELIQQITTGAEYHAALVALAHRYTYRGTPAPTVATMLRGLMMATPEAVRDIKPGSASEPGRWQARFDSIDGIVKSSAEKYAKEQAKRASEKFTLKSVQPAGPNDCGAGGPPAQRPVIVLEPGEMPRVVSEAEQALRASGDHVYQRGGALVRPISAHVPVSGGRRVVAQRLGMISETALAEILTRAADFQRFDARRGKLVSVDCPERVAATLLARDQWMLPTLVGVINAPTIRVDGSILDVPGYDAQSRLLFAPLGVKFPSIPASPSRADARAALSVLREAISTFPFIRADDEAVDAPGVSETAAVSAIVTALVRRSLPTAPMHGIDASAPGTGKTMLVDVAAMIATGRPCPVMGQGGSSEEAEKRLAASLMAGDAIINIDNCEHPLGGESLCQTLTQPVVSLRMLGASRMMQTPSSAAMFATGNNLTIRGDLTRRVIVCRLDAQTERPELRRFERDAVDYARERRGELVAAALTLVRAYFVAGCPSVDKPPLGSFPEWSRMVRDPLIWAGAADCVESLEAARAGDPEREQLAAVLTRWQAEVERRRVLAGDDQYQLTRALKCAGPIPAKRLIAIATETATAGGSEADATTLEDALTLVAGGHGEIDHRRLGKWLSKVNGRRLGGLWIEKCPPKEGVVQWKLGGFGGSDGLFHPNAGKCQRETNVESRGNRTTETAETTGYQGTVR